MRNHPTQTFGDILAQLSDFFRSDAEVTATVAWLLNSGRLRFSRELANRRVVVRPSLDTFLHKVRS